MTAPRNLDQLPQFAMASEQASQGAEELRPRAWGQGCWGAAEFFELGSGSALGIEETPFSFSPTDSLLDRSYSRFCLCSSALLHLCSSFHDKPGACVNDHVDPLANDLVVGAI